MTQTNKKKRMTLVYLATAVLAAGVGFLIHHFAYRPASTQPLDQASLPARAVASEVLGSKRPEFSLPDLDGKTLSIKRWDGQVLLINFWATWCPPCLREIPTFVDVLERYRHDGFQIVGIAIDDRQAVSDFLSELKTSYPQLIGEQDAVEISQKYGNRYGALPYSVLVDRRGIIRFIQPGELHGEVLEQQLKRLL